MIHVVPPHLDLATRETCWKPWSILLLKTMLKLVLRISRVVQLEVYDLKWKLKLCWNNWWLFTPTNQPCWCPNGVIAEHMIPVASWDPVEFHGQYCLPKPYSGKCSTLQPRTHIMGEGTGSKSDSGGSIMEAMSGQEHQDSSLPSAQLLTRKYLHYYYHSPI